MLRVLLFLPIFLDFMFIEIYSFIDVLKRDNRGKNQKEESVIRRFLRP
jgi:hypothetical protein